MRLLAPALAAVALAGPAPAQPPADNAAVLAAARALEAAQVAGDRAGMEAAIAPDFLVAQGNGRVSGRGEYIDGFTRPGARLQPFVTSDRLFLRASPDVAIVGGAQRITGTDNGRPVQRRFRYSDTWVRRGGRWVLVYAQVTPLAG